MTSRLAPLMITRFQVFDEFDLHIAEQSVSAPSVSEEPIAIARSRDCWDRQVVLGVVDLGPQVLER